MVNGSHLNSKVIVLTIASASSGECAVPEVDSRRTSNRRVVPLDSSANMTRYTTDSVSNLNFYSESEGVRY